MSLMQIVYKYIIGLHMVLLWVQLIGDSFKLLTSLSNFVLIFECYNIVNTCFNVC